MATKISDITSAVERSLKEISVCDIETTVVDKPVFKCYSDSSSYVTIRSQLNGTTTENSASLLSLIQHWVSTGPTINVNSVLLTVDSTCSVAVSSFTDEECLQEVDSASNTTSSRATVPLIYGVTVAGVVSLIIIPVLCIVAVIWRKRRNKYRVKKAWFVEKIITLMLYLLLFKFF